MDGHVSGDTNRFTFDEPHSIFDIKSDGEPPIHFDMFFELGDGVVLESVGVTGIGVERFFFGEVTTAEAVGVGEEGDGPYELFVAAAFFGVVVADDLKPRAFASTHVGDEFSETAGVLSMFHIVFMEWIRQRECEGESFGFCGVGDV